jgi:hypothetical protein
MLDRCPLPICEGYECLEFRPTCDEDAEAECEHGHSCWCTDCDKARCIHEDACRRAYESRESPWVSDATSQEAQAVVDRIWNEEFPGDSTGQAMLTRSCHACGGSGFIKVPLPEPDTKERG